MTQKPAHQVILEHLGKHCKNARFGAIEALCEVLVEVEIPEDRVEKLIFDLRNLALVFDEYSALFGAIKKLSQRLAKKGSPRK